MVCASGCCPSTSSDQVDWRMIHSISSGLIATSRQTNSKTSITRRAAECKLLTWCRCPFGRWLFFAIEKIFKTGCSKRGFLSDEIEGLFEKAAGESEVNILWTFVKRGLKSVFSLPTTWEDFSERRKNVNDLWIFSKGLLKIAFPWPMQWGDFFEGTPLKTQKSVGSNREGYWWT